MKEHIVTDADLNRYIDGEMDGADWRRLDHVLSQDKVIRARAETYRKVDEALREALESASPPTGDVACSTVRVKKRTLAAASLLVPMGVLAGWLGHALLTQPVIQEPQVAGVSMPARAHGQSNTVFHIDVDDKQKMEELLDRAEAILAAKADRDAHVEVVANAAGLNLLRADTSAVAPRVREMMGKYGNLSFVACAKTIQRLREQGVKVNLINRTHARETALEHLVDRLNEGWIYIKI
jgi:intracellular sulfur oxidation DsrE/DsrF family protein